LPAVLLTLILIPVFWVLIIRPQQKRQHQHTELVQSLVPGDRVEAFSGIHGELIEVHPDTVRIEIAEGVVVTMARLAIASRIEDDEKTDGQDDDVPQQLTPPALGTDDAS
jgi:preprotein translocase subunit YajC